MDRHTPSQNPSKLTSEWEYMDKVCISCIETNTMRAWNDIRISDVDKGYSGIYMTRLNINWKFPFTLERTLCHRVLVNSVCTLHSELCYEDQTRRSSWVLSFHSKEVLGYLKDIINNIFNFYCCTVHFDDSIIFIHQLMHFYIYYQITKTLCSFDGSYMFRHTNEQSVLVIW
jgi:hypothetical protein